MGNLGLINFSVWCVLVAGAFIDNKVKSDNSCDIEISETLHTLLNPREYDSLQVQALRRQLLRKLQEDLDLAELEDEKNYKRSIASLAAWNNLPEENKRNLEALARQGTWYKNPPDLAQTDDSNYKRSIANLAKNDQPPLMPLPLENQKRGIEALARNGDLHRHQNYQTLLDSLDFKRNVASLARAYNFPVGSTAGFGKRFVATLARNGDLPYVNGKRNIQSLARDGVLGKRSADYVETSQGKRNIQSVKAQQRNKRQADYFGNEVVDQMPTDYEDIFQDLAATPDLYPAEDKRFLGSVARSGWFRPSTRSFTSIPDKRHVAALARLGWLPSYRSVRRFNRSGRSFLRSSSDDDDVVCRSRKEDPPNGKTQNYSYSKVTSVPVDRMRYFLQPTVRRGFRPPLVSFY